MGVHDRHYMRDERSVPLRFRFSTVVQFLVLLLLVFLVQRTIESSRGVHLTELYLSLDNLRSGRVWTLLTAPLLHADFRHLLYNGIGLYFFGRLVEPSLGGNRMWLFLLLAALAAWVPWLVGEIAAGGSGYTIGASGIVTACLVLAALRHPRVTFLLMFVIPVPLWLLAVLYVAGDLLGVMGGGGLVNHWAHLGGAAYGLLVHRFGLLPALRVRLPRSRPAAARRASHDEGPHVRAEVDRLLDKISRNGIQSLTDEEREFLKRSSSRYR